jgi:hypothetical protein
MPRPKSSTAASDDRGRELVEKESHHPRRILPVGRTERTTNILRNSGLSLSKTADTPYLASLINEFVSWNICHVRVIASWVQPSLIIEHGKFPHLVQKVTILSTLSEPSQIRKEL